MICMKANAAVLIPIYKKSLNELEKISLEQVKKVLADYPQYFIAPISLDFDYRGNNESIQIERFDDCYFKGTEAYSALMLSSDFYKRFLEYEYVLIYQLDAFVFSDKLREFCKMDYDYIGAPWPRWTENWKLLRCYVGNGGLSLRKVKSVINLLEKTKGLKQSVDLENAFIKYEDTFFSYCGKNKIENFKIPQRDIALKFSVEFDVGKIYTKISQNMPFACHGWYTTNFKMWKNFIEKYGYKFQTDVDKLLCRDKQEIRQDILISYLEKRLFKYINKCKIQNTFKSVLDENSNYAIWGVGINGEKCIKLFSYTDYSLSKLYDSSLEKRGNVFGGVEVLEPNLKEILNDKAVIIICSRAYETEIAFMLKKHGMKSEVDFIKYSTFMKKLLQKYYI